MKSSNFPGVRPFALSLLAAALLSGGVLAQTTPPPDDSPIVVVEDRALRERGDERPGTLDSALSVVDPTTGAVLFTLPEGTEVGREKSESRFAVGGQLIRQRTDLRDIDATVTLSDPITVTNRDTGLQMELPAGTVLSIDRLKVDQRMDASGNVLRNRIDLRAVLSDGTRVRIRERLAPEIDAVEVENEVENEVGDRQRRGGRDASTRGGRSGGDRVAGEGGRRGRGSSDSPERFNRPDRGGRDSIDRPDRSGRDSIERVERPDRSGSSSDGGGSSGRH